VFKEELLEQIRNLKDEDFTPPLPVYTCSQDACLHFIKILPNNIPLPKEYDVINQEPWLLWPYMRVKFLNRIKLWVCYRNQIKTYHFDMIFHDDLLQALMEGTGAKVASTVSKTDVTE
jgi:hypothetical protein